MITDALSTFDPQNTPLTATRVSTNIYDLGANYDFSAGEEIKVVTISNQRFTTGGTVSIVVLTSNDPAMLTNVVENARSAAFDPSTMGSTFPFVYLSKKTHRYIRLRYDVTGNIGTNGTVWASFSDASDSQP